MITDDEYYAEEGFSNYVPSTTDPGPWMLFGVCIYSLFCIVCLPICVLFAKKRRKRRKEKAVKFNEIIANFSDKSIGPELEEVEEEDAGDFDNMSGVIDLSEKEILKNGMSVVIDLSEEILKNGMSGVIDLSGEGILKDGMIDIDDRKSKLDAETQKNCIDHDDSGTEVSALVSSSQWKFRI